MTTPADLGMAAAAADDGARELDQLPYRVTADGTIIAAFKNPNHAQEFMTRQRERSPKLTYVTRYKMRITESPDV